MKENGVTDLSQVRDSAAATQDVILRMVERPGGEGQAAPPWLGELLDLAAVVQGDEQWGRFRELAARLAPSHDLAASRPDAFWQEIRAAVEDGTSRPVATWPQEKATLLRDFPLCPRFLRGEQERDGRRRVKSGHQIISMRHVYVLGENGFHGQTEDFVAMARHGTTAEATQAKWASQRSDFAGLGMIEMANLVAKKLDAVKESEADSWLGFHRMKPSHAAATLARMHGMLWHDMLYVVVPVNAFGPNYWVDYEQVATAPEIDVLKRTVVLKEKRFANFDYLSFGYQPRLYPLHAFADRHPDRVARAVRATENLGEVGGPGFDYFWVLVPGINVKHPTIHHGDGTFRLRLGGEAKEFAAEADAAAALDRQLVRDGLLQPCVLAERDGRCYFLCLYL
jgi:hypothetical protein